MSSVLLFSACLAAASAANAQSSRDEAPGTALPSLSSIFSAFVETTPNDRRTRVTIDLRRKSDFEISLLNNPNRVVIDLPQVDMRLPVLGRSNTNGLVRQLRAGQYAPGRSRIVIDVNEPVVVEASRLIPQSGTRGVELQIDLIPFASVSPATKAALVQPTYSLGGPLTQPPFPRPAREQNDNAYKPLIVIDPGHGGKDSGAQKFGINEKDVVLAFSHTLGARLEKTGRYRVKLTRSTDVFIPLDTRREFAEDNTAALFIAVHADYAGTDARGATIYSLRTEVANRLREQAAADAAKDALSSGVMKYAAASNAELGAVRGILGDLAQREVHANLERTNVFTKIAIDRMGAATTMRSKPHREAAFAVLKTARVPSVLIELAYVSNRRDAARLQSQAWRDEVSSSLVAAIEYYFAQSTSQIAH